MALFHRMATDRWILWSFAVDLVAKCISNYEHQIGKTILIENFVN